MKTIILKWNPLYSVKSMLNIWEDIQHHGYRELCRNELKRWPIEQNQPISIGDQFYIVKLGYSSQGIIGHGVICSKPKPRMSITGFKTDTYYVDVEFSTLINPATLPILTIEELSQMIPTYDWASGFSGILNEQETSLLNQRWQLYIKQNSEIFLQYNVNADCVYRNEFLTSEYDIDYSPKAILIKWNPNTSPINLDRIFQEWGSLFNPEMVIAWPITDVKKFLRHDNVYIVMVGTETPGLIFRGKIESSPMSNTEDSSTWAYLRLDATSRGRKERISDYTLTLNEIAELFPQVNIDDKNEEIVLTKDEEMRMMKKLYSKFPFKLPIIPPDGYFEATDLPF